MVWYTNIRDNSIRKNGASAQAKRALNREAIKILKAKFIATCVHNVEQYQLHNDHRRRTQSIECYCVGCANYTFVSLDEIPKFFDKRFHAIAQANHNYTSVERASAGWDAYLAHVQHIQSDRPTIFFQADGTMTPSFRAHCVWLDAQDTLQRDPLILGM
jgi:hypothetical protein